MARVSTHAGEDRPAVRWNCDLDTETLCSVQAYLAARAQWRAVEPHLLEAWNRFYSTCDPLIRRLAIYRSPGTDDHQDRTQEIWRAVIAGFDHYDPRRGALRNWLSVVILHALVDYHRSQNQFRCIDLGLEAEFQSVEPDPASLCDLRQKRERVDVAMARLHARVSEANYRIVYDHWFEDRSFADLAKTLGLTVKQVRDRHQRAMAKLRELMGREG